MTDIQGNLIGIEDIGDVPLLFGQIAAESQ